MQQLVYFIQKYKYFLFFLLLQFVALAFTFNNNTFHKSKFISSANSITGGLYQKSSQLSEYFRLKDINAELLLENTVLKNKLEALRVSSDTVQTTTIIDSVKFFQKYTYISASIIKNDYHKANNYITIDKGTTQGVATEMAIINSLGIIGIVDQASSKYARAQSILNSNSKINE